MSCLFCQPNENINRRTFYKASGWFGFLAVPFYARGHTIIARIKTEPACPGLLSLQHLQNIGKAIADVCAALSKLYSPKDVLIASLRGRESHLHFHLIPLWEPYETAWRAASSYDKGHLFKYLALLETAGTEHALREMVENKWNEEEFREVVASRLDHEIQSLREITGFQAA